MINGGAEIMARGLDQSPNSTDRMGVVLAARAVRRVRSATVLQDLGTSVKDAGGVALLLEPTHPDERLTALSEAMGETPTMKAARRCRAAGQAALIRISGGHSAPGTQRGGVRRLFLAY